MTEQFTNGAQTTLNGAINNSVGSLTVTSAAGFPTTGEFRILIAAEGANKDEILLVTAVAGTTFTVTRAYETISDGTQVAQSHANGATVVHVLTAGSLRSLVGVAGAGWTAFTPSVKAGSTTLSWSYLQCYYLDLGAIVYWWIDSGSCTSGGSGDITIQDLPTALQSPDNTSVGFGEWADQGSNFYQVRVQPTGVSTWTFYRYDTYLPLNLTVGTSPADSFSIAGFITKAAKTFDVPALGVGVGVAAYKTSDLAMSTSGEANLTMDAEVWDTDNFHDNATNNQRFTVPAGFGGKYLVGFNGRVDGSANAYIVARKNGSTILLLYNSIWNSSNSFGSIAASTAVDLAAGDYIEFKQLANSAQNLVASGGPQAWAWMVRVDSGSNAPSINATYVTTSSSAGLTSEIIIPGLAGSPDRLAGGGSDDEFDTTDSSDPITGWTTVGSPASHSTNSDVLSHYYVRKTATAIGLTGIRKAWSPSNGAKVTCKISDIILREGNNIAGVFIGVSSPGAIMTFMVGNYGADRRILSYNFSSPTSFSSENSAGGIQVHNGPFFPMPIYLRMLYNNSTSVTLQWSSGGHLWSDYGAYNPGFTVGSVGLFIDTNDSTTSDVVAVFDWIRFT